MPTRVQISWLVFMMVQAVLFGIGVTLVLATPMAERAMQLLPWVVVSSFVISAPVSWLLAPRLQARFWRDRQYDVVAGEDNRSQVPVEMAPPVRP